MVELWRRVPGSDTYDVSDWGRVQCWAPVGKPPKGKRRLLKVPSFVRVQSINQYGHLGANVIINGRRISKTVHSLVLGAFVSIRPEGLVCRHLDGDPANNRLGNLAWGTMVENMADAAKHGTIVRGGRCWNSKMTEDQVRLARKLWDQGGWTADRLGEHLGVKRATAWNAATRRTYRDIV